MQNKYKYNLNLVDNILGITNSANSQNITEKNKAKLGVAYSHSYTYDGINRLVSANGKAKTASYWLDMTYGIMGEPLTKKQKVDSSKVAQSYAFAYLYEAGDHPTAPSQIGHNHNTYDANGNPLTVTNDGTSETREMYWDEDNWLMVLSDNGKTSRYTYNASGERIIKSHGTMEGVYINGAPQGITFHETDNFTLYPASILTVNKNRFTKHYFIGSQRIASRIGTGLFNNVYGRNGSYVTAGQQDYAERMNQIQKQKETYYKQQGIAPGVPTEKGAYGDPENTGVGYNAVLTELGNHDVPQGWVQTPRPNTTPNTNPGPPISWNDPSNPDDPQAGYGYIPNDTTKEETFFFHSDHLGSTSYITDDKGNITQYDAYLPYGELLVDEHSSSEELPYKFNGKQFDEETGLYYYGARYMNPMASIWYGVDPLAEKYVATGGYVYTLDNPVRLIDPNGNWSWPWERGSLIEYRGNGVFGIRIENFSKTMQSNFKRANNNPANWRPGELGINTEIGKISVDNYAHKSFTIGRKPAGIDPKDGNVRIRRPIAKSTGQEDRRFHSFDPMPVRGSAKAVGAIAILDFANYAVDTYMTLSTFWDSNAFDDQMASFRKAIRAVNSQMNSIPDNYRKDTNKMGAILNYVFQGENTTKDKNIDKIGQNILSKSGRYDRTNKTYKPFIKR